MSHQERGRRLPVFIDEDQWTRAYRAAKETVQILFSQGKIDVPTGHAVNGTLDAAAVEIATAALRAAAQDDEGDVAELPGVCIDQIGNGTGIGTTTSYWEQNTQLTYASPDEDDSVRYRGDIHL